MMFLYEVKNGEWGEAYERAYVWAHNVDEAEELYYAANPTKDGSRAKVVIDSITPLFCDQDAPFSTKLSDAGWEV